MSFQELQGGGGSWNADQTLIGIWNCQPHPHPPGRGEGLETELLRAYTYLRQPPLQKPLNDGVRRAAGLCRHLGAGSMLAHPPQGDGSPCAQCPADLAGAPPPLAVPGTLGDSLRNRLVDVSAALDSEGLQPIFRPEKGNPDL